MNLVQDRLAQDMKLKNQKLSGQKTIFPHKFEYPREIFLTLIALLYLQGGKSGGGKYGGYHMYSNLQST